MAQIYEGRGENDPLIDYALYDAALTAALDRIKRLQLMGYGSASDYDKGGLRAANEIRAAIAAGLGVTP